jgi:hypothetical protein
MSGEDPVMARSGLIGGGQSLVGFILGRALATHAQRGERQGKILVAPNGWEGTG